MGKWIGVPLGSGVFVLWPFICTAEQAAAQACSHISGKPEKLNEGVPEWELSEIKLRGQSADALPAL